jgi:hypothetical protein
MKVVTPGNRYGAAVLLRRDPWLAQARDEVSRLLA